jgi:hypothetical protein
MAIYHDIRNTVKAVALSFERPVPSLGLDYFERHSAPKLPDTGLKLRPDIHNALGTADVSLADPDTGPLVGYDYREDSAWIARQLFFTESGSPRRLLSQSAKTVKSLDVGVLDVVLYLSPADEAGLGTLCPWSTAECRAACLRTSGRMGMDTPTRARLLRTLALVLFPRLFLRRLRRELDLAAAKAKREGLELAVRLDGTSDLGLAEFLAPHAPDSWHWYDYTKSHRRAYLADRVHLTLSMPNPKVTSVFGGDVELAMDAPNLAVVVPKLADVEAIMAGKRPSWWPEGYTPVDGDEHDARYLDPPGSVVLLKAKGDARGAPVGEFIHPME